MTAGPLTLVLYHRSGCHLCDEMLGQLERWQPTGQFALNLVDVDSSPELQRRYGELVPVLAAADGSEICRYFLDGDRLERYLRVS